jgi:hypothetical protein
LRRNVRFNGGRSLATDLFLGVLDDLLEVQVVEF